VERVDPEMFVWELVPMERIVTEPLSRPRLQTAVLAGFGLAALALAAIGLYAVIARTVRDRRREIGIRMALGAGPGRVRAQVLREAALLIGLGGVVGLVVAMAGARLLANLLYQVQPRDAVASLGAMLMLIGAGALAGWLPARQATKVEPFRVLQAE
jgi:ABC-type antimicrobial peptide transport system permease subunit